MYEKDEENTRNKYGEGFTRCFYNDHRDLRVRVVRDLAAEASMELGA